MNEWDKFSIDRITKSCTQRIHNIPVITKSRKEFLDNLDFYLELVTSRCSEALNYK